MSQPSPRPEWLESAGKKDGRYLIGPLLGHGGMGDVHEAWDTLLGRLVALKILTHVEPAAMVRFMHEAQLQARLEHSNICRIYDIDLAGGTPRIAMQLVRGPTLEDAAADLELTEVVTLVAQVAETLRDAHRGGLIHRDVKPGNIILEWQDSGTWNPIICDFGLALAINESSLTQPNALTGTPAYMAPEQVRGDRRLIGPATDVYGLGGTLYFLLLGRPPCVSTVTKEMLRVKKEKRFPRPRTLEPSIPAVLEGILLRCLAPDPADRYASMDLLAKDLWAFLGKAPSHTSKDPAGARRLWLVTAASLAAALAFGGMAWRQTTRLTHGSEAASRAIQEAGNLEQGLRNEREHPLHDTRAALDRIRAAKASVNLSFGVPGTGPRELIAGTADFCLGDYPSARNELEKAWSGGLTAPETAFLLGVACSEEWVALAQDCAYKGQPTPPALKDTAKAWFSRAKGLSRDREAYAQALLAFMDQDLPRAVQYARASQEANPWRRESTALGSLCMTQLARRHQAKGDDRRAAETYREALEWAEDGLRQAESDSRLQHAAIAASLGLANLERTRGTLSLATLDRLSAQAQQALLINPDAPLAQGDWLSVRCLTALRLSELGKDPKETIEGALAFYWTRTRDPRPPSLRSAHMVLYGLVAQNETAHGRPSAAAVAEALKDAGHTEEGWEYLPDHLNPALSPQKAATVTTVREGPHLIEPRPPTPAG